MNSEPIGDLLNTFEAYLATYPAPTQAYFEYFKNAELQYPKVLSNLAKTLIKIIQKYKPELYSQIEVPAQEEKDYSLQLILRSYFLNNGCHFLYNDFIKYYSQTDFLTKLLNLASLGAYSNVLTRRAQIALGLPLTYTNDEHASFINATYLYFIWFYIH